MGEIRDYCGACGTTTDCKVVHHASGDETLCTVCGGQVDFDIADCEDDYLEACGSCENCGVNLYPEDDDELCDQCLWRSQF